MRKLGPSGGRGARFQLPPEAQANDRAMQDQIDAVFACGAILTVVDSQRAIANEAVQGCLPYCEIEAVAAKELPGEIAAYAKAADVTEELQFLPRCELVSHAQANERVDPFERAGARDGARTRPLKSKVAKIDRGVDRQ